MAEAAAVAAENNDHRICCFERCLFVQNLLLLLLSLLPGCPGSCILLLLLTERHSFKIGFHFNLDNGHVNEQAPHVKDYLLSILLVVLVVGVVVRARAEIKQGEAIMYDAKFARFGHLVAAAGGPAVAPGDGEGAPGQLPPGAPPPGA